jgi:hypothetical protein
MPLEDYARKLTTQEVIAWSSEPDVRMHMRALRDEPLLKSSSAVDDLNKAIKKAASTPAANVKAPPE